MLQLWPSAAAALVVMVAAQVPEGKLPPRHCVAALRSARIAGTHEDPAAELAALRRAVETCPNELGPIVALLSYGARHPLPAEEVAGLGAALERRLASDTGELPVAVLQQIAAEPQLGAEIRLALLAHLERRLASYPDADALRLLASLQLKAGNRAAAAAALERLRPLDDSEPILWGLAALYSELERWDELAALLQEPNSTLAPALAPLLIEALSRAGRETETLSAVRQLAASRPAGEPASESFVELVLRAAWNLRDAEDDAAAEELFRLALVHDPAHLQARDALTHLYGSAEERERYRAALAGRLATESDPNVLLAEGSRLLAEGDAAGAYELLAKAAPELAHLEGSWFNLGIAAFKLERWADAADAFGRAAEINPERSDTHFYLGHALVQEKRWPEAIAALLRSLQLEPERPIAHYDLYLAYQASGDQASAAKHREAYDRAAAAQK